MGTLSVDKLVKTSTGAAEFTLPAADGTVDQVMKTDGAGQLGFTTISADPTMGGDLSGLSSNAQIVANAVTTTEIVDDAVTIAKLAATGTASATTFLRGDNAWASAGKILQVTSGSISTEVRTTSTSYVTTGMTATFASLTAGSLVAIFMAGGSMATGSWTATTSVKFYHSIGGATPVATSTDSQEHFIFAGTSGTVEGFPHSMNYLTNPGSTASFAVTPYFKASSGDNQYFNAAGNTVSMILMEIGA